MIQSQYKDCLSYIESYWKKVVYDPKKNKPKSDFISIPNAFIAPNNNEFPYLFYWDTFFMFKGLMGTPMEYIMKDMIDNFIYLYKKYGIVPNFNSYASTVSSQPPFLSSMIFDVFNTTHDKRFLETRIQYAKLEYLHVWQDKDGSYNHKVPGFQLSKYGDRDIGYSHNAERESGWDFTSRFYNRCNEFLPIDLNCLLYKYEKDFAKASELLGEEKEKRYWEKKVFARREEISKYMWNKEEGFFYDYDYINKRQSSFLSLASFVPLWAGIATPDQAEKMIKILPEFETKYGLLVTSEKSLAPDVMIEAFPESYRSVVESLLKPKQWDYPNIFPPIEYLTVIGLLQYGFITHAKRIMKKSLDAEAKIFRKYNTFFEKIDGVRGDKSVGYHYPNQSGFGWTNAVFYRFVKMLQHIEDNGDDSIYSYPMLDTAPYALSIPH